MFWRYCYCSAVGSDNIYRGTIGGDSLASSRNSIIKSTCLSQKRSHKRTWAFSGGITLNQGRQRSGHQKIVIQHSQCTIISRSPLRLGPRVYRCRISKPRGIKANPPRKFKVKKLKIGSIQKQYKVKRRRLGLILQNFTRKLADDLWGWKRLLTGEFSGVTLFMAGPLPAFTPFL